MPDTGDATKIMMWMLFTLLSAAIGLIVWWTRRFVDKLDESEDEMKKAMSTISTDLHATRKEHSKAILECQADVLRVRSDVGVVLNRLDRIEDGVVIHSDAIRKVGEIMRAQKVRIDGVEEKIEAMLKDPKKA